MINRVASRISYLIWVLLISLRLVKLRLMMVRVLLRIKIRVLLVVVHYNLID